MLATRSYDEAEADLNITESDDEDIVLVEVEKIENLRDAYPNYFGDVRRFTSHLKGIVQGAAAFEFIPPPRQKAPPRERSLIGDLSWLRGARLPRPDEVPRKRTKDAR